MPASEAPLVTHDIAVFAAIRRRMFMLELLSDLRQAIVHEREDKVRIVRALSWRQARWAMARNRSIKEREIDKEEAQEAIAWEDNIMRGATDVPYGQRSGTCGSQGVRDSVDKDEQIYEM